jgi:L-fuculose-phosphate aldolase
LPATLSNGGPTCWAKRSPVADYGLPGTGKPKKGVAKALRENPCARAVLMAHHGALCVGRDAGEAFRVADALEQACLAFLKARALTFLGEATETLDGIHAVLTQRREALAPKELAPYITPYSSFRSGDAFCMTPEGRDEGTLDISLRTGIVFGEGREAPETLEMHRAIYRGDKKVNAIVHSQKPDVIRASKSGAKKLLPYLDDFAQIAGINLRGARFSPGNRPESAQLVRKALKGRSAVLLEDNGALCTGSSMEEARAVEIVTDKNCAVSLSADLFEKVRHIGVIDAALMRFIYVKKYSKKK